jgi:hypothetical protein
VDGFRAVRRLALARRRVKDFHAAAPLGPGRRVLRRQIQLFDPLPWLTQRFGDVADALFVFQNRSTILKRKGKEDSTCSVETVCLD